MKPLIVEFSDSFDKQLRKSPVEIKKAFRERTLLFYASPTSPLLNNHKLKGRMGLYRSINVTGDWRALYTTRELDGGEAVVFELLGTHSQLYK